MATNKKSTRKSRPTSKSSSKSTTATSSTFSLKDIPTSIYSIGIFVFYGFGLLFNPHFSWVWVNYTISIICTAVVLIRYKTTREESKKELETLDESNKKLQSEMDEFIKKQKDLEAQDKKCIETKITEQQAYIEKLIAADKHLRSVVTAELDKRQAKINTLIKYEPLYELDKEREKRVQLLNQISSRVNEAVQTLNVHANTWKLDWTSSEYLQTLYTPELDAAANELKTQHRNQLLEFQRFGVHQMFNVQEGTLEIHGALLLAVMELWKVHTINTLFMLDKQPIHKSIQSLEDMALKINAILKPVTTMQMTKSFVDFTMALIQSKYLLQEKIKNIKEKQRAIKEQMRMEEKEQKELERAIREAKKEEERKQQAYLKAKDEAQQRLVEIQQAMITANEQDKLLMQQKYNDMMAKLQAKEEELKEAQEKNKRALSMAQQTREGFVYIISNIGSFGENIYKIGMTRRLEPMDRVRELGDASVPFSFDVHAMISSNDAPTLEKKLHHIFAEYQVNKMNPRKEFFKLPITHIQQVLQQESIDVQWALEPEASDYRATKALEESWLKDPDTKRKWLASEDSELEILDEET